MNEIVKIWLDLSKSDLNSSKILYKNGYFRNSYFLFQQATEKANKAFALLNGYLTEKEIKSIQHDQLKIYRKAILKQEREIETLFQVLLPFQELKNHKIFKKVVSLDYHKSLKEDISFIDSLRNNDLVYIPTKELNFLLKEILNLKSIEIIIPDNYESIFNNHMLEVADLIGKIGTKDAIDTKSEYMKFINDKEQAKNLYDLIIKQIIPFLINYASINLTLYFCAIITIQHSSLTRYPENNTNPEHIYTKHLPLVKKQKDFIDLLDEAINGMEKINNA